MKKFIGTITISVIISFVASLIIVWVLSKLFGFTFTCNTAAIVGVLSAAASGASISAVFLNHKKS